MFISRREKERLYERIEELEAAARRSDPRVYINDDGLLTQWPSDNGLTLTDALNLLAKAVKVKWKRHFPVPAAVEAVRDADG